MAFDYLMGVGRTPQITQDVNINPYSAYIDDICQAGTISSSYTGNLNETGVLNNLINPNYTDTTAPLVIAGVGNSAATYTLILDLKRVVGLGKQNLNIVHLGTHGTAITTTTEISISNNNVNFERVYYDTQTGTSNNTTINKDSFTFGKFGRYVKFHFTRNTTTAGSTWAITFNNRVIIFPDYIQY